MPASGHGCACPLRVAIAIALCACLCLAAAAPALRHQPVNASISSRELQFAPQIRDVLATIYINTGGPTWFRQNGWLSSLHPCDWEGIMCNYNNTEVIGINMPSNNWQGRFPVALQLLTSLQHLNLQGNVLTGMLDAVTGIPTLQLLDVSSNRLDGFLPTAVNWPALSFLDISQNFIYGNLPVWFRSSPNLVSCNFSLNFFSGTLPADMVSLGYLRSFDASANQLIGSLPSDIGSLLWLSILHLQFNKLTGPLPASFGSLVNAISINLSNNLLSGTIPASIRAWTYIQYLNIGSNALTGNIPASMWHLTSLRFLSVASNRFNGTLSVDVGRLALLKSLLVNGNRFQGAVPPSLAAMTELRLLSLSDNCFDAAIDAQLVSRCNAQSADVNGNSNAIQCDISSFSSGCIAPVHAPAASKLPLTVGVTVGCALAITCCVVCICRKRIAVWLWPPDEPYVVGLTLDDVVAYADATSNLDKAHADTFSELRQRNSIKSIVRATRHNLKQAIQSDRQTLPYMFPAESGLTLITDPRALNHPATRPVPSKRTPGSSPTSDLTTVAPSHHVDITSGYFDSPVSDTVRSKHRRQLEDAHELALKQSPTGMVRTHPRASMTVTRQLPVSAAASAQQQRKRGIRPQSAPASRKHYGRRVLDAHTARVGTLTVDAQLDGPSPSQDNASNQSSIITPTASNTTARSHMKSSLSTSRRPVLPLQKPTFVDSIFVTDLPVTSTHADVASAYLCADILKDISIAGSETKLLDAFTRVFVMRSRNIKVPRKLFKDTCSRHRSHFPGQWCGCCIACVRGWYHTASQFETA